MNYRFTAILMAILVALGGYVYYSESSGPKTSDTANSTETPIFSLDTNAIKQIEITQGEKRVVVAKTSEGNWEVKEPALGAADDSAVSSMATRLASLKASRIIGDDPEDLAPYGLAKPQFQATMTLADGNIATLLFGNENPNNTYHYVKRADSPTVYLVYLTLGADLQKWLVAPPKATPTPTPFPTYTPIPEATKTS